LIRNLKIRGKGMAMSRRRLKQKRLSPGARVVTGENGGSKLNIPRGFSAEELPVQAWNENNRVLTLTLV
jgi:hypothetical protein